MASERGWSRRRFLVAATGAAAAGVAGTAIVGGRSGPQPTSGYSLTPLFSSQNVVVAGTPQRLPLTILDGGVPLVGGPDRLDLELRREGATLDRVNVPAHRQIGEIRYYPVRVTLPQPGIYDLVSVDPQWSLSQPVQAFAPTEVSVLGPGDPMPSLLTPTTDESQGVDPICTRAPDPCPLHDRTVRQLIDEGEPFLLLVATPAYCQTAFCGPTLFSLLSAVAETPGLTAIHAEVYENPRQVGGNLASPDLREAAVIKALGLTFEPSLFAVDSSGTIIDRLDHVADRQEIDAVVAALR